MVGMDESVWDVRIGCLRSLRIRIWHLLCDVFQNYTTSRARIIIPSELVPTGRGRKMKMALGIFTLIAIVCCSIPDSSMKLKWINKTI